MSYNPYGTDEQNTQGESQPLDQILKDAIDAKLYELHTCLPAEITADEGNGFVTVQPLLKKQYIDGTVTLPPAIQGVPVVVPRGTDYWVKLPYKVGDTGLAIFCERSIDNWKVSGGQVDPMDTRKHDMTDAVFVPGLFPHSEPIGGPTDELTLHNGDMEVVIQKGGTIKVTNGVNELIDLLDQLLDTLINKTFTTTLLGPEPFIASTNLLLTQIRQKLDTLKGS